MIVEIVIAVFLGVWLSGAAALGYVQLRKDFKKESGEINK